MTRLVAARVAIAVLLVTAAAAPAGAQGPRVTMPEPVSLSWIESVVTPSSEKTVGIIGSGAKDYRYTGMFIGLGTAAFVGVLGTIVCTNQDTPCDTGDLVLGVTAFAAIAGTIGAMIGHAFPKHPPPAAAAPGID